MKNEELPCGILAQRGKILHSSFFIKKEFMDNNNKKLTRSRSDRMLAGVCGGLAAYFGLDPSLVRIGYALLTFFTVFAGIPVYLIMWLIVPEEKNLYNR